MGALGASRRRPATLPSPCKEILALNNAGLFESGRYQSQQMEQLNVALKRVLMNLVGNALEFTPERGRIAIELEEVAGEAQVVVAGAE